MRLPLRHWCTTTLLATAVLAACGGDDAPTQAEASDVVAGGPEAGATPFIARVKLTGTSVRNLASVEYAIAPKAGTVSKAVDVTYTAEAAARRGYLSTTDGSMTIPVFGLYANHANTVTLRLTYKDGSSGTLAVPVTTTAYTSTYGAPEILVKRAAGSTLGFDYFAIKSGLGTPVVVDTDGEVRWAGTGITSSVTSLYKDNGFVIGRQQSTQMSRLEFDNTMTTVTVNSPTYTAFHHNLDPGKTGVLAEFDGIVDGLASVESIAAEVTLAGAVTREWDFAKILGDYMRSQGDDPSTFIRPGVDWFHMNATVYDPRDDTLIASSRENFVIKVDYQTGEIRWILGDPTKHWYTFPSLRAKALTLEAGGLYPIGQHALSIRADGLLMLFNNGLASANQPAAAPVGENRTYSAVSAYAIDAVNRTAKESWRFDHGQTLLSDVCSSAYEAKGQSVLISYATTDRRTTARLIGIDAQRNVVFDFRYPSPVSCQTSWNAVPVPFDAMRFE